MTSDTLVILAVTAFIYLPRKGILIVHKSKEQKVDGGFWTCPGGKVEKEEPILDALKREVKEEVGLSVLSYRWIGEDVFEAGDDFYHAQHFLCKVAKPVSITLEDKFLSYAWVNKNSLDEFSFHPNLRKRILEILNTPVLQKF